MSGADECAHAGAFGQGRDVGFEGLHRLAGGERHGVEVEGAPEISSLDGGIAVVVGEDVHAVGADHNLELAVGRPGGGPEVGPGHSADFAGEEVAVLPGGEEVGGAEELGGEAGVGVMEQGFRGAGLFYSAILHYQDPVAELHGFVLVVGDADGGGAALAEDGADFGAELFPEAGVEAGEGFVHQDEGGFGGEGAGEGDALLLAAGELVGVAGFVSGEADHSQGCGGEFAAAVFGDAESDIAGDGEVGEQGAFLEDHSDAAFFGALVDAGAVHGAAGDADFAGVGGVKAGDEAEGGGFAAAAGAEEAEDFARLEAEVDAGDGGDRAEGFVNIPQLQGAGAGFGGGRPGRRRRWRRHFRWCEKHFHPALAPALSAH